MLIFGVKTTFLGSLTRCQKTIFGPLDLKIFDFFGFFPNFDDFSTFSSDFASILDKLAPENHGLHKIITRYSALDTFVPSADG